MIDAVPVVIVSVVIAVAALWLYVRRLRRGANLVRLSVHVSRTASRKHPYPYVFVCDDEAIRELYQSEREYLETPFVSHDGGRPFVKPRFGWRNALDDPSGFLPRSKVPRGVQIKPIVHRPLAPGESRAEAIEEFRKYCGEIVEHDDGSISIPRPR